MHALCSTCLNYIFEFLTRKYLYWLLMKKKATIFLLTLLFSKISICGDICHYKWILFLILCAKCVLFVIYMVIKGTAVIILHILLMQFFFKYWLNLMLTHSVRYSFFPRCWWVWNTKFLHRWSWVCQYSWKCHMSLPYWIWRRWKS